MSKLIGICSFVSSLSFLIAMTAAIWTEKDEARRIAQIKSVEQKLYEEQMGEKLPPLSSGERTSAEGIITDEFPRPPPPPPTLHHSQGVHRHVPSPPIDHFHHPFANASVGADLWCFHCASPWNAISEPMQRVVKNLLEIRRAQYPTAKMVRRDCTDVPRQMDRWPRQICRGYSHCQTLILTDHDSGTAFTMRGCAERFGAVDAQVLARRGDNQCKRLHEKVDIQECICEHRKYCHAGPERLSTLRFTPMSEWRHHTVPLSTKKMGVPSAEALQRNKSDGGRREVKKTMIGVMMMIIMSMGMVTTMTISEAALLANNF